jgi:hypothetical protein
VAKAIGNVQQMKPNSITLANAGVLYFPFEQGGAVMIFWNSAENDFTQIIMNDKKRINAIRCASYLSTFY